LLLRVREFVLLNVETTTAHVSNLKTIKTINIPAGDFRVLTPPKKPYLRLEMWACYL
jgi:hypothetical protein